MVVPTDKTQIGEVVADCGFLLESCHSFPLLWESAFSGLTGVLDWSTGLEHWSAGALEFK